MVVDETIFFIRRDDACYLLMRRQVCDLEWFVV